MRSRTATPHHAPPPGTILQRIEPPAEALVFRGLSHPFERIAVPELVLHPGEALVQVELATVCGSDLHTVSGARSAPAPLVLGHEQVGRIVALGPGRAARTIDGERLAVGDRVVWGVAVDCGACRMCRRGMPHKCESLQKYGHQRMRRGWELNGGIATHVHLIARTPVMRVPETLPAEVLAPASCATATVMAALAAAEEQRPLAGELAVVSGCGMLGLTAVAAASEAGATVVAIDPDPQRRALAQEFGAAVVAEPGVGALRAALLAASRRGRSRGEASAPGFGVAWELSGANRAIETLFDCADIGASIVLVGSVFPAPPVSFSAEGVVRRLLTVRGVHNYRPEHLERAVRFLERVDASAFAALVGQVVPLDRAEEALSAPAAVGTRIGVRP
ncbi:alcohol dehydrogenase catalytic domain-containing protein [Protaetiibacter larvae]|uniref:alcohol dehydrogenase n=1 Tax=Protaetiibacter larvae TaxID=2592654 RepID=A0A5C1Y529_9MICO|nr:alcohol dehydrogenase catalytic domain-containing protein [Protaetiibacter larvae]QEO09143.1 alcohol dehydrogenase catalytic domain-containing protein [Protaetiibacter larvae]